MRFRRSLFELNRLRSSRGSYSGSSLRLRYSLTPKRASVLSDGFTLVSYLIWHEIDVVRYSRPDQGDSQREVVFCPFNYYEVRLLERCPLKLVAIKWSPVSSQRNVQRTWERPNYGRVRSDKNTEEGLPGGLFYSFGKRLKEQIEQLMGGDSLEVAKCFFL